MASKGRRVKLFTIGHSARAADEFVAMLKAHGVRQLIDVRSMPMSRFARQFNHDTLEKSLQKHRIVYQHLKILGGLRPTSKASINTAWRNKSFRGYADYMQTDEFAKGIDQLEEIARNAPTAIMCAEAVPWRCHRRMVGDAMLVRGWEVIDIFDRKKTEPEHLTAFAVVNGDAITYTAKSSA